MARTKKKPLSEDALRLIAQRFKALSDPTRLKLIMALRDGPKNVGDLVAVTEKTQANVSRHLQHLADAGILDRSKSGLHVFYSIADPGVFKLCDVVCGSLQEQLEQRIRALS